MPRSRAFRGLRFHRRVKARALFGRRCSCYDNAMAKAKKLDLENPAPALDEEDQQTLAAIDEGMRDADAGRTVPAEEVRRLLPKWTTVSSTRKKR